MSRRLLVIRLSDALLSLRSWLVLTSSLVPMILGFSLCLSAPSERLGKPD